MATKKLYWFYLKKLLWKSWRVWIIILFSWVWWGASMWASGTLASAFVNAISRREEKYENSFLTTHKLIYQGHYLASEETIKWMEEHVDELGLEPHEVKNTKEEIESFKNIFAGLSYEDREKEARHYWEKDLKNAKGTFGNLFKGIDVKGETYYERWKRRFSYMGIVNNIGLPFRNVYDYNLVEFASPRGQNELNFYQQWGLINNISIWNFTGFMISGFFVYTLIDKLFFDTKKNGEDAMVVNFTPGIQRGQIFFSKVLAYIAALAVFVLLGCVLPYGVLIGMATGLTFFPWLNFLWLALYSTIIGSLCFTLIAGGVYLFFNTLGTFGRVLQWLMSYLPLMLPFLFFGGKIVNKTLAFIQYWYYHPVVHLGLAAGLGYLLFSLYLSYYKQEDLN